MTAPSFAALGEDTLDAAADIWTEGWAAGHAGIVPDALSKLRTRDDFKARLSRRLADTVVALQAGAVQGFYILDGAQLYQFYVSATARGSGLAAEMMRHAEDALWARGHRTVWLGCSVGNTRAARFYEKSGWRNMGSESFAAETSEGPFELDIWRFEKNLLRA